MATPIYQYSVTFVNSITTLSPSLGSITDYRINLAGDVIPSAGIFNYTGSANSSGALYYYNGPANYPTAVNFLSPISNLAPSQVVATTAPANLPSPLNCYLAGTLIETAHGQCPVETLRVGDQVRTASGALRPIRWIGTGEVRQNWLKSLDPQRVPVRIRAGALGGDAESGPIPRRDLLVTHNHGMVVDGVLIPAAWLRNGASITSEFGLAAWDYYHIELESHDILLAEGAASESYRPCGNRSIFDNAASAPVGKGDDHEPPCLPIVLEGPVLERAIQGLVTRAISAEWGLPGPAPGPTVGARVPTAPAILAPMG